MKTTALHLIAEEPMASRAFGDLRTWILGGEAASSSLHEVEIETSARVREVARLLLQEHVESRGIGDVGDAIEIDDGEGMGDLLTHRRVRERKYLSLFGPIRIGRQTFGRRGRSGIAPLDEELSLPSRLYSYPLQRRLTTGVARGPFAEAVDALEQTTGTGVSSANVYDVVIDAAKDFDAFYAERSCPAPDDDSTILVATIDGKGVPMRPAKGEAATDRPRGSKGPRPNGKREARVAAVYLIAPNVRTPADILGEIGEKKGPRAVGPERPRPQDKRVWASLEKSKDDMFAELAEEMLKRDPQRKRTRVCITDGDPALQNRALAVLGAEGVLVLDIFHVTEYLWEAGRAFHGEGTVETREWVDYYLEKILYGEASEAARGMRQSATKRRMRGAKRRAVDKAARYILRNQAFMKYDEYLAAGIPIRSGVAEGTCRHLVKDRMERTGMRWTMRCAEAVLKMRAIEICGDTEAYWDFHIGREQARLHTTTWRIAA